MPATFTPTPEQLALREARLLRKDKAAINAGVASSSLVNNEKGQVVPRPWLALQDSPTNGTVGTRPVKIITWNVSEVFSPPACTAYKHTISALITLLNCFHLLAQCLVREWTVDIGHT
jgi:DNA-binding XRE family transcriptional regulator